MLKLNTLLLVELLIEDVRVIAESILSRLLCTLVFNFTPTSLLIVVGSTSYPGPLGKNATITISSSIHYDPTDPAVPLSTKEKDYKAGRISGYMTSSGKRVFLAGRPEGPFLPLGQFPQTPMERMALDGTLWVEEEIPYMVFCHEWVQIVDGGMDLVRLSEDLSQAVEAPQTLFHASAADWSTGSATGDQTTYVTDGCFLYRTHTGKLLMIWSSFKEGQYAMGVAESVTGRVAGPWR